MCENGLAARWRCWRWRPLTVLKRAQYQIQEGIHDGTKFTKLRRFGPSFLTFHVGGELSPTCTNNIHIHRSYHSFGTLQYIPPPWYPAFACIWVCAGNSTFPVSVSPRRGLQFLNCRLRIGEFQERGAKVWQMLIIGSHMINRGRYTDG